MAANSASPQTVDSPIQRDDALAASNLSPSIHYLPLADGVSGTFQTLAMMAQVVKGNVGPDFCGWRSIQVQAMALGLGTLEACFNYVAKEIKYLAHPPNEQVIQDACRTMEFKTGDCVSKSVLLASLLIVIGYKPKFIAQYWDDAQMYSHVYVMAVDEYGQEIRLDPVASDKPMGWTQQLPDGGFETPYDIF